ncbi:hypothetical protein [Erythrobacter aureus]|uniref:hypothetical protein n=1 Tax=Erythrobacter aureus TaxID=2182384 RepID=UPI003A8EEEB2
MKKEALRKAGIGYHEIVAGHTTPSELRALVEKLVPAGQPQGSEAIQLSRRFFCQEICLEKFSP